MTDKRIHATVNKIKDVSMEPHNVQVLCSGYFNLLHAGHVELLAFASKYGKVTVAINDDEHCQRKYGTKAMLASHRLYCLNACKYVESTCVFGEDTPSELILRLKPKYYIRGYDYANKALPEEAALELVKAQTIIFKSKQIKIHTSDFL
jgi:FAD synthetase